MKKPKISIIILTFNAPLYVYKTLKSLQKTDYKNIEIIVFDNNSRLLTKLINLFSLLFKWVDKLIYSKDNILFSPGNNQAFKNISDDTELVLLLNSDIEIKNSKWLDKLVEIHERGIVSYGAVMREPIRADGYCLLVNRDLYEKYQLDEDFEWWWGITKLQANLLANENCKIKAVKNHNNMIVHFGGASRKGFMNAKDFENAKGLKTDIETIKKWFGYKKIEIINLI